MDGTRTDARGDNGPMTSPISKSTHLEETRAEYTQLFATSVVRPERVASADALAKKLAQSQGRYEAVARAVSMPWQVVAVIHLKEGGGTDGVFDKHLHNGDPLTDRTVHTPKGHPVEGTPPFTWEQSATDALARFRAWTDWSAAGTLWQLERYNGWGYRNHGVPTPYLWAWTQHYEKGKFVGDGHFDPEAVSSRSGVAAVLRRMEALSIIPPYAR